MSLGQTEKVVSKHQGVQVTGRGTAKLLITNRRLIFEKKASAISSKVVPLLVIEAQMLESVEQENDFLVSVNYKEGNVSKSAKLRGSSPTESIEILQAISSMLGQRRREEDDKKLREKEMKLKEMRFVTYVLDSSWKVGEVASRAFDLMIDLLSEDWERVEETFKRLERTANTLMKENSFDLNEGINLLSSSIESRSVVMVAGAASKFLTRIGEVVESLKPPAEEWRSYETKAKPDWASLRYLLLFSIALREEIIFQELGLEKEREIAVSKVRMLMPIIGEKFGKELFKLADLPKEGESLDKAVLIAIAEKLSSHLRDSLQESLKQASLLA